MNKSKTMKGFRAAYLINRYLHGTITTQESAELETWLNNSEQNRKLFEELCSAETMEAQLQQFGRVNSEAGWQRLQQKADARLSGPVKRTKQKGWWQAAAAILILGLATWQILNQTFYEPAPKINLLSQYGDDVLPGTKKAELILSDGTTVALDNNPDSSFTEKGCSVLRTANGTIIYSNGAPNNEIAWNTIRIPSGGEYLVVLEDGTKVWLNAASSLRYPVQFSGSERRVELTGGEAYFEIAKNKEKPFIVVADKMEIQAVGTAFNVNSYANADSFTITTLTNGLVKIHALGKTTPLLPGEQMSANNLVAQVAKADTVLATAWKNGLFMFKNAALQEVMQQLARWYDLELVYAPDFKREKFFTGEIKRQVQLSKVLQMMEMTGIARFAITGNKVTILSYNY